MNTYYTYHKKFSQFSIGGVSRNVERKVAKSLISRFKGKLKKDRFNYLGERTIDLGNGNYIFIYVTK